MPLAPVSLCQGLRISRWCSENKSHESSPGVPRCPRESAGKEGKAGVDGFHMPGACSRGRSDISSSVGVYVLVRGWVGDVMAAQAHLV